MSSAEDARKKAAETYNAAADFYDYPTNTFWERYGRRTIERLQLIDEHVIDVCCGSGASAIPAAKAVAPTGYVVGIDLAENLLELARRKANQQRLTNIHFQTGDLTELEFAGGSFDVAVCVFGIFFVPDMESGVRELRRVVRPGGRVAITTWGPRFFEPVNTAFWNSVRNLKPELYKGFNPWDRICEPEALRSLLNAAELKRIDVQAENGSQPIDSPEDWWPMVMGSGYRGTLEQLSPAQREQVKKENLDFIRAEKMRSVETNVLYAQAFV
jgi:ubiquinone/menaquinone biosynthesis C-methylase UbiE